MIETAEIRVADIWLRITARAAHRLQQLRAGELMELLLKLLVLPVNILATRDAETHWESLLELLELSVDITSTS